AADERLRLYQTGGFAVADRGLLPPLAPPLKAPPAVEAPAVPAGSPKVTATTRDVVVLAGRVHTGAKGTNPGGAALRPDGKIGSVGPRKELEIPAGAAVISAAAVSPGLIDAHSVVPLTGEFNIAADQDADETSDPNQADARVQDAFNPNEPLLRFLLEKG